MIYKSEWLLHAKGSWNTNTNTYLHEGSLYCHEGSLYRYVGSLYCHEGSLHCHSGSHYCYKAFIGILAKMHSCIFLFSLFLGSRASDLQNSSIIYAVFWGVDTRIMKSRDIMKTKYETVHFCWDTLYIAMRAIYSAMMALNIVIRTLIFSM